MNSKVASLFLVGVGIALGAPQYPQQQPFQPVRGGYNGDPSLARIIEHQRFNIGNGDQFGHAAQQEDGVIIMEEASSGNNRVGAYSYIGDDGKTYSVKYEAGIHGFRILDGDHVPSGGQNAALAKLDENEEPYEYDYEYYEDIEVKSPFVNPYDPSHHQPGLLEGNLAGHLAGVREAQQYQEAARRPAAPKTTNLQHPQLLSAGTLLHTTTPRPNRFFPEAKIKWDRFPDGFFFNFKSNKK